MEPPSAESFRLGGAGNKHGDAPIFMAYLWLSVIGCCWKQMALGLRAVLFLNTKLNQIQSAAGLPCLYYAKWGFSLIKSVDGGTDILQFKHSSVDETDPSTSTNSKIDVWLSYHTSSFPHFYIQPHLRAPEFSLKGTVIFADYFLLLQTLTVSFLRVHWQRDSGHATGGGSWWSSLPCLKKTQWYLRLFNCMTGYRPLLLYCGNNRK